MTSSRLGECLRIIGWSQRELARQMNVSEATVRRWMGGQQDVPVRVGPYLEGLAAAHTAARMLMLTDR